MMLKTKLWVLPESIGLRLGKWFVMISWQIVGTYGFFVCLVTLYSFSALVVASGVTYGGREDALFYWFQKAWECERLLPLLGRGGNVIPLINVLDLAQ